MGPHGPRWIFLGAPPARLAAGKIRGGHGAQGVAHGAPWAPIYMLLMLLYLKKAL